LEVEDDALPLELLDFKSSFVVLLTLEIFFLLLILGSIFFWLEADVVSLYILVYQYLYIFYFLCNFMN